MRTCASRDSETIERRIDGWLGRYTGAEMLVEAAVLRDDRGRAIGPDIQRREQRLDWASRAHGTYLLRTNCSESDAARFWKW